MTVDGHPPGAGRANIGGIVGYDACEFLARKRGEMLTSSTEPQTLEVPGFYPPASFGGLGSRESPRTAVGALIRDEPWTTDPVRDKAIGDDVTRRPDSVYNAAAGRLFRLVLFLPPIRERDP